MQCTISKQIAGPEVSPIVEDLCSTSLLQKETCDSPKNIFLAKTENGTASF